MTMTAGQRAQRGLSMIGFLFVAAVVLVVAMVSFRMIPAYIEYYTIQRALEGAQVVKVIYVPNKRMNFGVKPGVKP